MGQETRANKELARYNSELQVAENQRQEQFNANEWTRQFGLQEQQWQQHFAQETDWNSEQAKAQRLREVGVNPIHALSNAPANVTTANTGAPSVSPRSGISPGSAPYGTSNSFPMILNTLNDSIKNLSESELRGAESRRINQLLAGELKMQFATLQSEREKAIGMQLANFFEQHNMPVKLQGQLVSVYQDISEMVRNYSQAKNFDASSALMSIQEKLASQLHQFKEKMNPLEYAQLEQLVRYYPQIAVSQINLNRANANEANASARERIASAINTEFLNGINNETKTGQLSKFWDSVQRSADENIITSEQKELLGAVVEQAKYANDNKELVFWTNYIKELLGTGVDVVGAFTKMKSAKAFEQMSENQRADVQRKIDDLEYKYGDESTIEYAPTSGGSWKRKSGRVVRHRKR